MSFNVVPTIQITEYVHPGGAGAGPEVNVIGELVGIYWHDGWLGFTATVRGHLAVGATPLSIGPSDFTVDSFATSMWVPTPAQRALLFSIPCLSIVPGSSVPAGSRAVLFTRELKETH